MKMEKIKQEIMHMFHAWRTFIWESGEMDHIVDRDLGA